MADRSLASYLSVVFVLVAACVLGGCADSGSSESAQHAAAVERSVRDLERLLRAGDVSGLCALMSPTARRQAGEVAHGQVSDCPSDLREALAVIDSGGGLSGALEGPVDVRVEGERATATVRIRGHGRVDVPMVRAGSRWRLDSFFGTPPRQEAAAVKAPVQSVGRSVRITEQGGARCFPLYDDYPVVDGGCNLEASDARLRLEIGTVFGAFKFADCRIGYRVLTDSAGRAWTDSVSVSGPDNVNNGCSDVRACDDSASRPLPWRGRIVGTAGGGFAHVMQACLDTCIGLYTGRLEVTLNHHRDRWRATAANAGVGRSGLRFDGEVGLATGRGFAIAIPTG